VKLNDLRKEFSTREELRKATKEAAEHGNRKRGFPCYRCRSEGVIKSTIGIAPCPICEKWLRSHGWVQPDEVVPCAICKTDHAANPDSACWRKGVDLMCPTHAVSLQEGWLANANPRTGPCDECEEPGIGYVTTSGATELHVLCKAHYMKTPAGSLRPIPAPEGQSPKRDRNAKRKGFPAASRCVRCRTTKHISICQVSLGDGRLTRVRICRECLEKKPADMDDVYTVDL